MENIRYGAVRKCTSAFEQLSEEEQELIKAEERDLMASCPPSTPKEERWRYLFRTQRGREIVAMYMAQPVRCCGKDYSNG